ncbi:hypothetical protein A2867_01395 [Candidatus Daviesbacteria bacterium RIFCSPHIGHO2_01_FULL_40_11]|uniref:Uncharacterized protein n=1 Tax=Candidatus Daviesbacteria bacterium RIFCSPHIGHO2_01_FULL_40_11 TaxID=1797762 RepID=A0A1F5JG86_9BACT|nr:MAG: hypothetical protein A2867_01395 [Candidatus Daviesbacteria bacterium RIFCSPHIGHO2_01_FULL_40_11]
MSPQERAEQRRQNFEADAFAWGLLNPDMTTPIEDPVGKLEKAIKSYSDSKGWKEFWEQGRDWEPKYPWKAPAVFSVISRLISTEGDSSNRLTLTEQLLLHAGIRRVVAPTFRERIQDRLYLLVVQAVSRLR